jgi:hypothetical protein
MLDRILSRAAAKASRWEESVSRNRDGISNECEALVTVLVGVKMVGVQCSGGSCSCLDLQACLQRLLEKAAHQPTGLNTLLELKVHMVLSGYLTDIKGCPHAAAARLAVAEAFYK